MTKKSAISSITLLFLLVSLLLVVPAWAATGSLTNQVASWVTNPFIAALLLAVGLAGLVLEIFTVGFGVAGTIGVVSLGLYFGGAMVAGNSGWEAVLFFILGLIALLLEILVIPGFGIAGILGIGLVIFSIFIAAPSPHDAVISLLIAIIGSVGLTLLGFKFMTKRKLWNRIILGERQVNQAGYSSAKADLTQLIGSEGESITPLRPAGTANFHGQRVDVVTEGGFIPAQVKIKVIAVEGSRVIVRQQETL